MSFFFGGDSGITYEELQRKRMIADALMKQQRPSRNVGEGIGSFAKQISGALINRKLNKRDRELQQEADEMFGSVFGGGGSPAMAGTAQPSYATPERNAAMAQSGGPTQAAADQMAGNFPASLVRTESGGNWNALNNAEGAGGIKGHGGRLQFGGARLQDAARAGVVPPMSPQEFAQQPPEVQQRVEQWHFSDIDQQAKQMGLDRFIGQTVGGIPINRNAIRAMAHLGGVGGAAKFLQSGGQINPADVNGTSLADYARTHGQGQRGQPAGVQVANAGGGGPGMAEIARALSNPYIRRDPGKMAILQSLMQNRMNANDPMARIEMQRAQQQLQLGNIELERARNPQPEMTANQRNYEYLIGQGVAPEAAREMTFGGGGIKVENNMPGTDKFQDEIAKGQADIITGTYETGRQAESTLARVNELDRILGNTGSGAGPALRQFASQYGLEIGDDVGELQAAQAIINQLIPAQRPPGSGEMSNMDLQMFKQSVPSLINRPGGNALIIRTMRGIAEYDRQAGQIAARAMTDPNYTREQAFRDLYDLENPLREFQSEAAKIEQTAQPGQGETGGGNPGAPAGQVDMTPSLEEALSIAEGADRGAGVSEEQIEQFRAGLNRAQRRAFDQKTPAQQAEIVRGAQ